MVLDDIVHIGSSNFDIRSLYLNMEMMLRVDDAEFAQLMRSYFERELARVHADHAGAAQEARDLCSTGFGGRVVLPGDERRLRASPAG